MMHISTKVRCVLFKAQHRVALEAWLSAMQKVLSACNRANELPLRDHKRSMVRDEGIASRRTSDINLFRGGPSHGMGAAYCERALAQLNTLAESVLDISLAEVLRVKSLCARSAIGFHALLDCGSFRRDALTASLSTSDALVVDAWRAAGVVLTASKREQDDRMVAQSSAPVTFMFRRRRLPLDVSLERLRDSVQRSQRSSDFDSLNPESARSGYPGAVRETRFLWSIHL